LGTAQSISTKSTIDPTLLLTSADSAKPSADSLSAPCGSNKKKKRACANCTCGLAEELISGDVKSADERRAAAVAAGSAAKSACGSCYLGDAFRCAACPYLGQPAFKPGVEKPSLVQLDDDIMDI